MLHHLLLSFSRGELPLDHSLLRQVSSLVRRLPAIDSAHFREEFLTEYNDTLLMTYLAGEPPWSYHDRAGGSERRPLLSQRLKSNIAQGCGILER